MNKDRFFNWYKKIIKIDSSSSEIAQNDKTNIEVINFLKEELIKLGFSVQIFPVKASRNKFNLVAQYGSGSTGGIAFSGHTDTVPAVKEKWHSDPWTLTFKDNKILGLGSIDMKGFFAFVLETLSEINLESLNKPVYVFATADEETTMNGARELTKFFTGKIKPDLIVIGEPTSMVPIIMHKGQVVQTIKVHGTGGHASNPDVGLNAIKILHEIVSELFEMEKMLRIKYHEDLFSVPFPSLNIGEISGGDAPNKICEYAELTFEIRPLPGQSSKLIIDITKSYLDKIVNKYPNRISTALTYDPAEPFGGSLSKEKQKNIEEITGKKVKAVNYATEAAYMQTISDTIVMGPGNIDMAHQPDEYLSESEIEPSIQIYKNLIQSFAK